MFGDGQDDAIVGGYGNDWISGGTGDDGILGDDGRIFASRNSTAFGEPLYGIAAIPAGQLNSDHRRIRAAPTWRSTNVGGLLKYTVDLTPYSLDPSHAAPTTLLPRALYANDIIYGGLGQRRDPWRRRRRRDLGRRGAERARTSPTTTRPASRSAAPIRSDYAHPFNPGNVLGYNPATTKFALYDANDPLRKILLTPDGTLSKTGSGLEWVLNFNETEGPLDTHWISRAPRIRRRADRRRRPHLRRSRQRLDGRRHRPRHGLGRLGRRPGQRRRRADDLGGLNNQPDTNPSWEDLTYGGAGRDVMIGNTGGDRLVDWNGEFNTFVLPYNPFGLPTVSRGLAPSSGSVHDRAVQEPGRRPDAGGAVQRQRGAQRRAVRRAGHGAPGRRGHGRPERRAARSAGSRIQGEDRRARVGGSATAVGDGSGGRGRWQRGWIGASISDSMLAPVVEEAKLRWTETLGAGDSRLAALSSVNVQVGNLPGDRIG